MLHLPHHLLSLLPLLPHLTHATLKIASATNTIEYTPELITSQDYYNSSIGIPSFTSGGVPNLFSDSSTDIAANAETQALRNYASHKNLRIISTVAEVPYRLVVKKTSAISSVKDLKGKKIGTVSGTSAAYFVERIMSSAGLADGSYSVVSGSMCYASPCGSGTFPQMLQSGAIDAVGTWEPNAQLTIDLLGSSNVLVFQNSSIYRELFNLHTTTDKLNNAAKRKEIVQFLKELSLALPKFTKGDTTVESRVAKALGWDTGLVGRVWNVQVWGGQGGNGTLATDLLGVLEQEDGWVAKQDNRAVTSNSVLAQLIDTTVMRDALALSS